jgi:hypothetical protein
VHLHLRYEDTRKKEELEQQTEEATKKLDHMTQFIGSSGGEKTQLNRDCMASLGDKCEPHGRARLR